MNFLLYDQAAYYVQQLQNPTVRFLIFIMPFAAIRSFIVNCQWSLVIRIPNSGHLLLDSYLLTL